jgi:Leucine-rich repeat (LRR) protein
VAVARKDDPEWYNEDANFLAAVQTVLDAKARVLGPARLERIAGLVVEEAEQHAPFVLESAKSGDAQVVRAALTVLNSFEGFSAWKAVDKIALEALHRSTDGGGEVGRTERVSTRAPTYPSRSAGSPRRSSQGLYLADKGWCSGAPLHEWVGVTVDERAGRVTELQLKGCGLKGHLPPELAFLSDVETLDLRDNPDLDVPAYARELGLLDVTGQMHFTDKGRVQAFLKHVALTEGKKEEALLVQKHGLDGPALKCIYDEGSFKFETGHWFDKENDVSKWHGVSVDAEGRVSRLNFDGCSGLSSLTERLGELKALQTLDLRGCKGLLSLPERLGELETLQTLNLHHCTGLLSLPERLGELTTLQTLNLQYCSGLVSLQERLGELKTLQTLNLQYCSGLVSLPERLGELKTLQTLNLHGCTGLVSLPERLGELKTLQSLSLTNCSGLVSLPERLGELKTLQTLYLDGCSGLVSLPDLSGLGTQLEVEYLPDHLQPWKASGYKAFSLSNEA